MGKNVRSQLQEIVDDFRLAQDRLLALVATTPEDAWMRRPDPEERRWSPAECVAHLNLTSEAFLPELEDGLAQARALREPAPRRYRRDPVGWLLWATMSPPVRMRVKTAAAFVPGSAAPPEEVSRRFLDLQQAQIDCVAAADDLPLGAVRIRSPFDQRVSYNLFSCLSILPRHQHRHLWQAEQAVKQGTARA